MWHQFGVSPFDWAAHLRAEKERKERELPGGSFAFQTRRAGRVTTRYYNRHLRETAGLRSTQLDVLAAVKVQRNEKVAVIARHLGMAPCTLLRSLRRLEEHGLVTIEVAPADKRALLTRLTKAGEHALKTGETVLQTPQERTRVRLGEMLKTMRKDSEKIADAMWIQMRQEYVVAELPPDHPMRWRRERAWEGWTDEQIYEEEQKLAFRRWEQRRAKPNRTKVKPDTPPDGTNGV